MNNEARALRVYVAGSGLELPRVRAWMAALREAGVEVTKDWTIEVEAAIARGGDAGLTEDERARAAHDDLAAVLAADLVWMLAPVTQSRGAWVEFGYALGKGKLLGVSGRGAARSIFTSLASRVFEQDADAFAAIVDHADQRRGFAR